MRKKGKIIRSLLIGLFLSVLGLSACGSERNGRKIEADYRQRYLEITADDKEIEKKWLVDPDKIPYDLETADKYIIEQTYLCFSPEIRVRRINNGQGYTFTVKTNMSEDGLVRDEFDIRITEQEYYDLLEKKEESSVTIHKTRYQLLDESGQILAIDIFQGGLEGLVYLEIEFANESEALLYVEPEWITRDVTDDIRYKNASLARYGIPTE